MFNLVFFSFRKTADYIREQMKTIFKQTYVELLLYDRAVKLDNCPQLLIYEQERNKLTRIRHFIVVKDANFSPTYSFFNPVLSTLM